MAANANQQRNNNDKISQTNRLNEKNPAISAGLKLVGMNLFSQG
jgi:hypothetical protein